MNGKKAKLTERFASATDAKKKEVRREYMAMGWRQKTLFSKSMKAEIK